MCSLVSEMKLFIVYKEDAILNIPGIVCKVSPRFPPLLCTRNFSPARALNYDVKKICGRT